MKSVVRHSAMAMLLASGATKVLAQAQADPFKDSVQPLLQKYCITCHSTEKQKGELDLERFSSLDLVKREPGVWEHSLDQIREHEMPPKKEAQPTAEEKATLTKWMQGTLDEIALANAGDPGPVVLRRLSNMEYTYTLRDLTGVESLDPAKEFPVDGAAGEGFTNAGAALVMSPALLTKYLDAAKEVATHVVLTPTGIRFSEHTTPPDWTEETLRKIRGFYATYSDPGGGTSVNLQGIALETNAEGRVPVEQHIKALVRERDALRSGTKTIEAVAKEHGVNAKYAALLWTGLNDSKPSVVLDEIRRQFNAATPDAATGVARRIQDWQQSLWRFASVGHIGKTNGPKGWQEPVSPLGATHPIRMKIAEPKDQSQLIVYLVMRDIEGSGHDLVTWEDARVVAKDKKEVMLRDIPGALPLKMTVQSPAVIEVKIPTAMVTPDMEFAITAKLAPPVRPEACVQLQILTTKPVELSGLQPSKASSGEVKGTWSDNNLRSSHSAPVLVNPGSVVAQRFESAFAEFRHLFPAALCYTKIVPTDEVVTLTLFHREDNQLKRLMLDEAQSAELDRLWQELLFVSEAPLKQVDVFEQLWQFATQDAKPEAFEPMREPIMRGAATFKDEQAKAGPKQLWAVLDFAERAWRRPLTTAETSNLRALYQTLRQQKMPHPEAVRMLLARVLVSPAFLYRGEKAAPGPKAAPVNDYELATRLSYFLWSSAPDDELRTLATSEKLHEPEVLVAQMRRMMKDARARRLATEFGCQWLHVRDVAELDEKSERHFPTFISLRGDMQEETVRFFMDLFQADRSVLSLLDADHSFVNGPLAKHYSFEMKGDGWQRVDGLQAKGRGGILGFAATLAKQSGASRTSPILRGNWLSEVVLGEKLPRPPKDVPVLPEEAPQGLTERQLIERHSSDAKCSGCHQRIDPFGFALEGFDAIGRARTADTHAALPDGTVLEGLDGLRAYLLHTRRDDFLKQFCRKLLGYALGRSVQLSDKPLIESMLAQLKANEFRVSAAIEAVVRSEQFRKVRGKDYVTSN